MIWRYPCFLSSLYILFANVRLKCFLIFSCIGTGNLARVQCIRNGISADTVCTVDFAAYLTCCIEAGDDVAIGIKNFSIAIDL